MKREILFLRKKMEILEEFVSKDVAYMCFSPYHLVKSKYPYQKTEEIVKRCFPEILSEFQESKSLVDSFIGSIYAKSFCADALFSKDHELISKIRESKYGIDDINETILEDGLLDSIEYLTDIPPNSKMTEDMAKRLLQMGEFRNDTTVLQRVAEFDPDYIFDAIHKGALSIRDVIERDIYDHLPLEEYKIFLSYVPERLENVLFKESTRRGASPPHLKSAVDYYPHRRRTDFTDGPCVEAPISILKVLLDEKVLKKGDCVYINELPSEEFLNTLQEKEIEFDILDDLLSSLADTDNKKILDRILTDMTPPNRRRLLEALEDRLFLENFPL